MELLRNTDETEKLIMALHKAISLKCPLVVESDIQILKVKEFRLSMMGCVNCKLIKEDCDHVEIYTYAEFKKAINEGKISNLDNLVINNIHKFVQSLIGSKLKNLFLTSD